MSDEKKYPVPQDVRDMWAAYCGLTELRDRYVKLRYFGYKPAARAAKEAEIARMDFWEAIYVVYPDLRKHKIKYDASMKEIFIVEAVQT